MRATLAGEAIAHLLRKINHSNCFLTMYLCVRQFCTLDKTFPSGLRAFGRTIRLHVRLVESVCHFFLCFSFPSLRRSCLSSRRVTVDHVCVPEWYRRRECSFQAGIFIGVTCAILSAFVVQSGWEVRSRIADSWNGPWLWCFCFSTDAFIHFRNA